MKLKKNLQLFKETFFLLKTPQDLAYPTILVLGLVILFFILLWFVFANLINNALVDIVDISQKIQEGIADYSLQQSFDASIWHLSKVLIWFILACFFLWCLFGSLLYKWIAKHLHIKLQEFVLPFTLLNGVFALYAIIILAPAARLSFFFPSSGQLILLTIAAFLVLAGLHFLQLSYGYLFAHEKWYIALKKSLVRGIFALPTLSFSYLLVIVLFIVLEFLLHIFRWIHLKLYLAVGILLVFPILVLTILYLMKVSLELTDKKSKK